MAHTDTQTIVDIKPDNMEDLTEVVTSASLKKAQATSIAGFFFKEA